MKVSIKWLRQLVDLDGITPIEIANKLTFAGIEVEDIIYLASASGLVIGEIKKCEPHPNSDHLHILQVDLGEKYGINQIVCGAPNARKGLKVIVARVGAKLPELTINAGVIRGVESNGMCCSLSELGVDKKYLTEAQLSGIEELPSDALVGNENVLEYLGLDDVILDMKLLANRSDCNAMISVAKEVASLFERKLTLPEIEYNQELLPSSFKVDSVTNKCQQFSAKVIEGIEVKESPLWLKQTLMAMGIRSINNIVDIGNYVMLMFGQPLHMYDLDLLPKEELVVKDNFNGDFIALDEKTYQLQNGDLVVTCDDIPMCLGGVMGALSCAVTTKAKRIVIEAADFLGAQVRKTSIRLNLGSESSARFIKGINPHQYEDVLAFSANMIKELCGASKEYQTVTYDKIDHNLKTITTSADRINNRLGTSFSEEEIISVLQRVGVKVTKDDNKLITTIPAHRIDITCDADLSEEVIRILGFEHVNSELPTVKAVLGGLNEIQVKKRNIRYFLLNNGLDEILTYTLISKDDNERFNFFHNDEPYKLLHPMTDEHAEVRKSLISSMLGTLRYNVARQAKHLSMFEVSEVFVPGGQSTHLCVGLYGYDAYLHELKTISYDFYSLKGIFEAIMEKLGIEPTRYRLDKLPENNIYHPGRSAGIYFGKELVGVLGEIHPLLCKEYDLDKAPCLVMELLLSKILEVKTSRKKMQAPSKFPFVERDLALIVKENIKSSDLIRTIKKAGKSLVKDVTVFDIYKGEHVDKGYVSIAIKIKYQNDEKTLQEKEILESENAIKEALFKEFSIVLRG